MARKSGITKKQLDDIAKELLKYAIAGTTTVSGAGRKGGLSKSKAKQIAARKNGKKGGRPKTKKTK